MDNPQTAEMIGKGHPNRSEDSHTGFTLVRLFDRLFLLCLPWRGPTRQFQPIRSLAVGGARFVVANAQVLVLGAIIVFCTGSMGVF